MAKKPFILGVDPGITGAMALLCVRTGTIKEVFDIPTHPSGIKNRKTVHITKLAIKIGAYADEIAFCVIEDVHSTPNDGPVGAFAFGKSTGILLGVIGSYMIPIYPVSPLAWKSCFGLSRDKNESRALAAKKFPLSAEAFSLKKDHGKSEAVLLAEFGKRFY